MWLNVVKMEEKCEFYSEKMEEKINFFYYSRWPTASPTALFFWPFTNRHVTLLPRPTPGLKPNPQGTTPQLKPTQDGALGLFPQPTPQPKPHTPRPNTNNLEPMDPLQLFNMS
ncbi:hypothetical protein HanXRQr2_Chr04g0170161 [Helianthus annuus]|uniref:Uncharacterized protein n=1 Tax=Helianthus annuus TaxID=4232 RepID=A0A9K3J7W2_HELAN|nr:hypothetical protein HanXRQr2_Chr04g0170161 [Helianthus annuus]